MWVFFNWNKFSRFSPRTFLFGSCATTTCNENHGQKWIHKCKQHTFTALCQWRMCIHLHVCKASSFRELSLNCLLDSAMSCWCHGGGFSSSFKDIKVCILQSESERGGPNQGWYSGNHLRRPGVSDTFQYGRFSGSRFMVRKSQWDALLDQRWFGESGVWIACSPPSTLQDQRTYNYAFKTNHSTQKMLMRETSQDSQDGVDVALSSIHNPTDCCKLSITRRVSFSVSFSRFQGCKFKLMHTLFTSNKSRNCFLSLA